MLLAFRGRSVWQILTLLGILNISLLWPRQPVGATIYDWDNWTGDNQFKTVNNWLPTVGAPPGQGDTAIFDGQLTGSGVGENIVEVDHGTTIDGMQVYNSTTFPDTVVDLTIGDGTTSSQFYLTETAGNSLVIGNSDFDAPTLNLFGGWFDTWDVAVGGAATFNVVNPGSYWDSRNVVVAGFESLSQPLAGIGLGEQATATTHGNLMVSTDNGRGRVVVDGTFTGAGSPSLWAVLGSVELGPATIGILFSGSVTLRDGGQMTVGQDFICHDSFFSSNTLTVQTGGDLDVAGRLVIEQLDRLELYDEASTITTGSFDNNGGTIDWIGGTLHITDGHLDIDNTIYANLGTGNLTIDNGMTLKVTSPDLLDSLTIGDSGTGEMIVHNGGVVESHNGIVGGVGGGDGTVHVVGTESRWTVTDLLYVGAATSSVGRLNLSGSEVEAEFIFMGMLHTADGTITVDDATLTSASMLAVGGIISLDGTFTAPGGTGQLTVENGGIVDVGNTLIAFGGSRINLAGSGSQIKADTIRLEPLAALIDAPGTAIFANTLLGFGDDPVFAGDLLIGHSGGTGFGSHTVSAGQSLTGGSNLAIGTDAPATLAIAGGTVQTNITGFVGGGAGSDGSSVDVRGAGSSWTAYELYVGGDRTAPQAGAVLTVADDAQVTVTERLKVWGTGALLLDDALISANYVDVEGDLIGNGLILLNSGPTSVSNHGLLAPGLSAGLLTIDGNASTADAYVQDASGRLIIEIGGADLGQYDQLNILYGSAALNGILDVVLIDPVGSSYPYMPKAGNRFQILNADDGLNSTVFATQPTDLPTLTGALAWDIVYGSDFVRLDVLTPFTADFDGDGDVDGDDLAQWQSDLGGPGSDADGDGDSDGGDFLAWQQQFGSGVTPLVSSQVVPEPSTVVLLAGLVAIGIVARHRSCVV